MKLAQALLERKEIQNKIGNLVTRFNDAAVIRKGDEPEEDWRDVHAELLELYEQKGTLIANINRTNNRTIVDGMFMMDAIVLRDILKEELSTLEQLHQTMRYRNHHRVQEVQNELAEGLNLVAFRKNIDLVSKRLRDLDQKIQQINWTADLITD